ncbi:MAG: MFS transporter [Rhizobium sp.]|nr:MFS transporter [Rhizobium sp.]
MSGQKFKIAGAAALVIGHCAGMLDLIALPIWVGALVERLAFTPQMAGAVLTLFLLGAVLASVILAPRFNRLNQRMVAAIGFSVSAAAFFIAAERTMFGELAILHLVSGLAVGAALSMVHGTMGRAANPHRLFAMAGIAIGLFAIVLLGAIPQLMIAFGIPALFLTFGGVMAFAAVSSFLFFPNVERGIAEERPPFSRAIWLTILGISFMTFNQAMVFSFVEVIGRTRGFETTHILGVLIALGIVNLVFPSPLAAILEKRISATAVTQAGPAVQAVLAIVVTSATAFQIWAPAAAIFVAVQIFTHTFAFGLLARLDPTGRAVAATPAMLMVGAALGPIFGGALGENLGFAALGIMACVVSAISISFFTIARSAGNSLKVTTA